MRVSTTRVLVTVIALFAVLWAGIDSITAQDTGAGGQLPEGVAVAVLANHEVDPMPAAPAYLGLARLTYEPGASTVVQQADGPTMLHVESGSLMLQTGEAAEVSPSAGGSMINTGEEVLIPAGTAFTTRNDGTTAARAIRVVIHPFAPEPVAAPGIRFERLAASVANTLPNGRAFITLSRVTLTPGANTITRARQQDGPDLAYVDVGTLGLTAPGTDSTHSPGNMVFVEAGVEARARNAGIGPVVFLVVSIGTEPVATDVATPVAGTPVS
jgi:quercetin dioxygenase-like cupin family protein